MSDLLKSVGDVLKSLISNELVVAIAAALIAYLFALRAQKSLLREQQKLSVYDAIWTRRDELSSAIIELSAQTRGLATEYIMLGSINNTRNTCVALLISLTICMTTICVNAGATTV